MVTHLLICYRLCKYMIKTYSKTMGGYSQVHFAYEVMRILCTGLRQTALYGICDRQQSTEMSCIGSPGSLTKPIYGLQAYGQTLYRSQRKMYLTANCDKHLSTSCNLCDLAIYLLHVSQITFGGHHMITCILVLQIEVEHHLGKLLHIMY